MIYVVRHGETEWNAINKVLGRTDIPLNANGMNQARELARSMNDLRSILRIMCGFGRITFTEKPYKFQFVEQ